MLYRISIKVVQKTPYELWTWKKFNLRYMHIWRCPIEDKIYSPQEKYLTLKQPIVFYIGYPEKSKGYRFYYPSYTLQIVQTNKPKILKLDGIFNGSGESRDIVFEKI